jgi:ferredoxin, 2Fe-2S
MLLWRPAGRNGKLPDPGHSRRKPLYFSSGVGDSMALLRVVDRDGVEHEVEGKTGLKVMENLRELDYGVAAICGGMCSCATCHVYVDPDWQARLPAIMSDERELLSELTHYQENSRLSCQLEFTPELTGLRVRIAPDE